MRQSRKLSLGTVGVVALTTALVFGFANSAAAAPPLKTCDPNEVTPRSADWLTGLMATEPVLAQAMNNANKLRFQVVVGEIVKRGGKPDCLRLSTYRHAAEYTYPASAIKVVGAFGALRAMQSVPGWELDSPIRISPLSRTIDDQRVEVTPGTESTLRELLDKTLVVSSNLAFNSLYDIASRDAMNQLMHGAGFDSVRLWHRLSQTKLPDAAHAWAPRVDVKIDDAWKTVSVIRGPAPGPGEHPTPETELGVAYIDPVTGTRVAEPMSFAQKNGVTLLDLLATTVVVARPDLLTRTAPLGLTPASRDAMREAMTKRPEGKDEAETLALEARFKPLSPGVLATYDGKRERFRYINKAGRAYGFHLESAYVEDVRSGRAFFVAATLWPNDNQVLNDNAYEYDELSYPALQALGRALARELLSP